ncbi:iduronate-2-sulfatase [Rhodopirellula sp. SM50]|nr:sulfatase [Rhodopirellula sp. SM50]PAY20297.1 iduronate-2-sulfatase [Rhodopirellula sp. SM50]
MIPRLLFACLAAFTFAAGSAAAQPPREIKNVVMIVADDLKASVLGCYGDKVCATPNLDRLARNGMVFQRAYCQGTWCLPSRISFMFGRYRDKENVSLGQHLQTHGFSSTRVGKIFHMRVPGDIIAGTDGQDHPECWSARFNSPGPEAHTPGEYACLNLNLVTRELQNRQSTRMPHRMFVSVKGDADGTEQPDYKSAGKAIELLKQSPQRPFFLAVGLVRPHYPMVAPSEYFEPYPMERIEMPANWHDDTDDIPKLGIAKTNNRKNSIGKYPDNQKRMWAAYYASVTFMDHQVGRILDALEDSPHRDQTAVIFTSDHGYHLGEHGFWQKSNLHEEVIRVPLLIDAPGMPSGQTESLAELVDLYPTICDLVGVPVAPAAEGTSLMPVLADSTASVKSEALSFQNGTSIRTDRWHMMRYNDDSEELYDMHHDPGETTNLANQSEYAEVLKGLRERLRARTDHFTERKTQR